MAINSSDLQLQIEYYEQQIYELQKTAFYDNLLTSIETYISNFGTIALTISNDTIMTIDNEHFDFSENAILGVLAEIDPNANEEEINEEEINEEEITELNEEEITELDEEEITELQQLKNQLAQTKNVLKDLNESDWYELVKSIINYMTDFETSIIVKTLSQNEYYLPNNYSAYGIDNKDPENPEILSVNIIDISVQNDSGNIDIIGPDDDINEKEENEEEKNEILIDDTIKPSAPSGDLEDLCEGNGMKEEEFLTF